MTSSPQQPEGVPPQDTPERRHSYRSAVHEAIRTAAVPTTIAEIMDATGCSKATARRQIASLKDDGLIVQVRNRPRMDGGRKLCSRGYSQYTPAPVPAVIAT